MLVYVACIVHSRALGQHDCAIWTVAKLCAESHTYVRYSIAWAAWHVIHYRYSLWSEPCQRLSNWWLGAVVNHLRQLCIHIQLYKVQKLCDEQNVIIVYQLMKGSVAETSWISSARLLQAGVHPPLVPLFCALQMDSYKPDVTNELTPCQQLFFHPMHHGFSVYYPINCNFHFPPVVLHVHLFCATC